MRYRSRTDIVAQILEAAATEKDDDNGIKRTEIMYKAFLSNTQLKEFLSLLVENGLLDYHQHNQTYKTTEKGVKFIQVYNHIGKLIANCT